MVTSTLPLEFVCGEEVPLTQYTICLKCVDDMEGALLRHVGQNICQLCFAFESTDEKNRLGR